MIFHPVLNVFLLVLLFAPVAFVVVRSLSEPKARRNAVPSTATRSLSKPKARRNAAAAPRWLWALRLLMLLACFFMLLRPGIPGGATQTLATDTDIVIAVDTTASIAAEDWDGDAQRLDGVRADVQSIVDQYPGARFALVTFDASAELRLPLTTDATALISSLEILSPEVTSRSRGSSIGIANQLLEQTLANAAEAAPDRSRMVFYLGDGEQTADTDPESFSSSAEYVDGGAVLGYGTGEGGPMRVTSGGFGGGGEYIEYQGEQAMSVIDESNLEAIADELGLGLHLRAADTPIELPAAPTTTTDYTDSGSVGDVIELYWIFALIIIVLLGVELARATMLVAQLRGMAAPSRSLSEPKASRNAEPTRSDARAGGES